MIDHGDRGPAFLRFHQSDGRVDNDPGASSKESETGTSMRGRAANISPGAGCSCAVTPEGTSTGVTVVVKVIINVSTALNENNFR